LTKQVIHVNQHLIKKNRLSGEREPVITFKKKYSGPATLAHQVAIVDENGREVCRVVCNIDHPLPCGATVWIETELKLVPMDMEGNQCLGKPATSLRLSSAATERSIESELQPTVRSSCLTTKRKT
jgi:hypothetical protein